MNKFKKFSILIMSTLLISEFNSENLTATKQPHESGAEKYSDEWYKEQLREISKERHSKKQRTETVNNDIVQDEKKHEVKELPLCTPCQCDIETDEQILVLPKINDACGHFFHRECLISALSNAVKSQCPTCRTEINLWAITNQPKTKLALKLEDVIAIMIGQLKQKKQAAAAAQAQARAIAIDQNRIDQFLTAVTQNNVQSVEEHLEDYPGDINARDNNSATSLIYAAILGHIDLIHVLLSAEADIEAQSKDGMTALIVAAFTGNAPLAGLLLTAKPNLEARNIVGNTALIVASHRGHANIVKILLNAGANIEAQDMHGTTALSYAAAYNQPNIIKILLRARANINTINNGQTTPLMIASKNGHIEAVRVLLDHDAEIEMSNGAGDTALSLAQANGHQKIVDLLSQYIVDSKNDNDED